MTTKITSLEGLTPLTGADIATSYVFETEEFFLADDVRALLASQAEPAKLPGGMVLAPHFRGYAALGIGAYVLNHSAAGEPAELVISVATEEEKAGRQVGDTRDNPPDAVVLPDAMAVRLRFENVAGLDALEQQLRFLRAEHFVTPLSQPHQAVVAAGSLSGALNHARDALRFYAEGNHFMVADKDAWDTVSGEPQNFQCDEAGTATVEDGWVAKQALEDIAGAECLASASLPVGQALDLAAIRDQVLEEAAKVADTFVTEQLDGERIECGQDIARAIRALRSAPVNPVSENGGVA